MGKCQMGKFKMSNGKCQMGMSNGTFPLKWKLIIIIGISILVAIGVTLFFVLQDDKKDDKEEEDSIEVLPPIIIDPISEYTHCIIWLHGMDNSSRNVSKYVQSGSSFC